ncbi:hypothetical protein [Neisseria sp. 74A18]|uniref:hypothetical protein n=1 Tax=Neisseria sp. 74A18 TaxID=1696094 RepID=UPI0006CAD717|nr:hypothetical protein [Neisseria sp. 74A18]KPN73381.1 hypothetical protein AKG43_08410 [Neisseria sp. 74A18]
MNWVDRGMQKAILESLMEFYGQSISQMELGKFMWPEKQMNFAIQMNEKQAQILGVIQDDPDEFADKFIKNILYLTQHGLIETEINGFDSWMLYIQITHKGIDFLQQDGGLSAILGVVTVKLHSDTIQELLAAKIDQADITEAEKGRLKTELGKIKDAALGKLTENAIDALPAASLVTLLKTTLGL